MRIAVKLAASIAVSRKAARQSSELPAKASIASSVRTKTRSGDIRAILQATRRRGRDTRHAAARLGFALELFEGADMDHTLDRLAIRDLVENWAVWRDAGDWERFRTVWHDDGVMMATWFQGPADEFIRVSREGWDKGVSILHFLGGIGDRRGRRRARSRRPR